MNLTEFSVRNRPFTLVVALALAGWGAVSFRQIPRSEDPALRIPVMNVIVVNPGSNPVDLERRVARPLEDALKETDDLRKLQSTIRDGQVVIMAEFEYGTDPDRKYDDVLRQVNAVRDRLPAGIVQLDVRRVRTLNVALMQVALVSEEASLGRLQDLAESLRKRLEAVPGVRRGEKWGYPEKQVQVVLDLDRMSRLGLPPGRLLEAIRGANQVLPGGAVEAGERRFTVKTTGALASLDELRELPVSGAGLAVVRLRDVAEVRWDYEERDQLARFNGRRAVLVTVQPQSGRSAPELQQAVRRALDGFRAGLPSDVALEVGFDQAENVARRLGGLGKDFALALFLVLVTVLPLGWRPSLLVMVSVPFSLAVGVALLRLSGYSLDQLSIVGLVIALGLLVDDSIVVVENIVRFRRDGRNAVEAAVAGTRQITAAVLGTTATLLFAFLPLLLLPGGAGQFIRGLPLAVVYTVGASLLASLTLVPFLASRWLTGPAPPEGNLLLRALESAITRTYRPLLRLSMRRRGWVLGVAGGLLAASLALVPRIGFSLFPRAEIPQFAVRVHGAEGNSVSATDDLVRQVEDLLRRSGEVEWWFANVGRGNPQVYYNEIPEEQSARMGEVFASLKTRDPRVGRAILGRLRAELNRIPGARVVLKEFENGPPLEAPIAVRLVGEDWAALRDWAARVEAVLREIPGTLLVDNPVRTARTDLRLRLDRGRAGVLGVAEEDVDRVVRLSLAGLVAGRFREEDGDEYNITLTVPRGERASLDSWRGLQVPTASGAWVALNAVASFEMESSPPLIQRYNRERTVTLTSQVAEGYVTDRVTREAARRMGTVPVPPGCRFEFGGEVESRQESFGGLGGAIILAVGGVLAVLALEFRSFRGMLAVASVVPLGVIGGLVGLWWTGWTLSFTAAIGFIALLGIEIKNSILLVDFTNRLRAAGLPLGAAIAQAGEVRFLPVVLTTLTAVGALLPLAWARSALYSPLAVVMIGGLLSSLVLGRVATPVMYSLLPPGETGAAGDAAGGLAAAPQPAA